MAYAGGKSLTFYDVQDVRQYQTPKPLEAYGVTAAPQSWQYIDVQPELLEHGHALQNTRLGFIMPFAVCIPSALRYWYRRYVRRFKGSEAYNALPDYDAIWFEGQATREGTAFIEWLNAGGKRGGKWR